MFSSILRSGFLTVASEFGNQSVLFLFFLPADVIFNGFLHQFQKLGDDDEFSSTSYPSFGMANPFLPLRRPLENLVVADELESLDLRLH